MFYSHEILTDRQYGVATIWLVATIGPNAQTKRVTRKAIQNVNLQRACEKIVEPGAPIALRLQGSLLYGVSRVYNQQCSYVLNDAEKIRMAMTTFFKHIGANLMDPDAGHARPESLMIQDDPDFTANVPVMPNFDLNELVQLSTQKTSSQFSPHSLLSVGSGGSSAPGDTQLQIHSDHSEPPASPYALGGLASGHKDVVGEADDPFAEDDILIADDWELDIDEYGNIVERNAQSRVRSGPEVAPLPVVDVGARANEEQELVDQRGFLMMEEEALPEAEAFPTHKRKRDQDEPVVPEDEDVHPAPTQRRRRRGKILHADSDTQLRTGVIKQWQTNYSENCCVLPHYPVNAQQAKKNGMLLTFGMGIANIGASLGVPKMMHPLAMDFSGDALFTAMTGLQVQGRESGKRGRSASESIHDSEEERRVRARLSDEANQGRGGDKSALSIGDPNLQSPPEVGREAQAALDDHLSSAMPWNRGSSAMPGSSIPGSMKPSQLGRSQPPSSPLGGRGSVQEIVRYDDDVAMGGVHNSDDPAVGGGAGNVSNGGSSDGMLAPNAQDKTKGETDSQYAREALDREGHNFLEYMEGTIREHGERRQDEDFGLRRKWVAFDDVFLKRTTTRPMAAQAFYHVLTLVTKGQMLVEQEDGPMKPFGPIHVGLTMP